MNASKLFLFYFFSLAALLFCAIVLGHEHKHGGGGGLNEGHFHEHEHEDHKHWYTKEANEKLKESLQEDNVGKSHPSEPDHYNHHHGNEDKASENHGHGHGHSHEHNHNHEKKENPSKQPIKLQPIRYVWLESILSTALISAAPFFILFFVPLESNSPEQRPLLKILLSFASGGLLGDAFLHLIPHAISPHSHTMEPGGAHSHSHGHSHAHEGESSESSHDHSADMIVGLWVLAGLVTFLIVEKFVRHVKGGHSHSHIPAKQQEKSIKEKAEDSKKESSNSEVRQRKKDTNGDVVDKAETDHDSDDAGEHGSIKVSGYLNLAADFTHNFTDGLAIGASYLVSRNVGLITTLTILLHEVPHEIGDFAILVQSGCSKKKAMWLQLSTATGALAGTLCGLLAENIGNAASSGILPFTAGGFIYIATVSVIPELLEDANIKQSFKEILALFVGVLLMVVIAMLE